MGIQKIKKISLNLSVILTITIISIMTQAGVGAGGGGHGVLCFDKLGLKPNLELLDIWEAKNVYGQKMKNIAPDVQSEIALGLQQLTKMTGADSISVRKFLDESVYPLVAWLPSGSIQLTTDANFPILPPNCKIVQIAANYGNEEIGQNSIQILLSYWKLLDQRSQAALLIHETLYLYEKHFTNQQSSDALRRRIGLIYSNN